jgi:hypothetical protein
MRPPEPPVRCARQARGLSRASPARGAGSPPLPAWILPEWRCAQCAAQCYIASSVWRAGALARWRRNCAARSCPLRKSKFRGAGSRERELELETPARRRMPRTSPPPRPLRAPRCAAHRRRLRALPLRGRPPRDRARTPAPSRPACAPCAACAQPRFRMPAHGPAPRAVAEARSRASKRRLRRASPPGQSALKRHSRGR